MRLHTSLLVIGLLVSSAGCLNLDLLEGSTTPEGAVIVNFTAHGSGGAPAGGMVSADFEILEDGEVVSEFESQQIILNPKAQFRLVSILLLDMSGSILESGNLSALQDAAVAYVEATTEVSEVGIYRFDGREDIIPVVEVTDDLTVLRDGIESLGTACDTDECDASTNLNGAVIETLSLLDDIEDESPRIFAGSVVVFTDGTDRASRASADDAVARVKGSSHDVYSIGLGGEVDRSFLNKIGKSGTVYAGDAGEVSAAFAEVAASVSEESKSFYALVYCSPSRAGRHEVTIKGTWGGKSGSLKYEFDADGFDGTCDTSEFEVAEGDDDDDDDTGNDDRYCDPPDSAAAIWASSPVTTFSGWGNTTSTQLAFSLTFEDQWGGCFIQEGVGYSAPHSDGDSGTFDFTQDNDAAFAAVVACLTDPFEDDIVTWHLTYPGGGGGAGGSAEGIFWDTCLIGAEIDVLRLNIVSLSLTQEDGGMSQEGEYYWEALARFPNPD